MLAPFRDLLCSKNPLSSPLLHTVKGYHVSQLPDSRDPDELEFGDAHWVMSEDVNIEHLLNIFTSVDANSESTWDACAGFIARLSLRKPRLVTFGQNIEGHLDSRPSKPQCLFRLSRLLVEVGNYVESKRLLDHALKLWRDRGDLYQVASMSIFLSDVNRLVSSLEEAIQLAKGASEIFRQLEDTARHAQCLSLLARLLLEDNQVYMAEETACRAISLLPANGEQVIVYQCHPVLSSIYCNKGNREKVIEHLEVALEIASSHNLHREAFWAHKPPVKLFADGGIFDDANAHLEQAKLHAANNASNLAHVMSLQAYIWYHQRRFREAGSEAFRAAESYERIGATSVAEISTALRK